MSERLRRSREVRAVLSRGRAAHGAHAVVRCLHRGDRGPTRWTVSAGKRVGSAVDRNRAKRRLRAAVRDAGPLDDVDMVIIARASAVDAPFDELRSEVCALIARCSDVKVAA